MALHFKVEELLSEAELEEFRTHAREPGRTWDELHQWMQERGYTLSRGAVGNWKQKFDEELLRERFSRNGALAASIKSAVNAGEFDKVADAAVMQLTNVVFEQANKLEAEGEIDPLDVQRMTKSLSNLVGSKDRLVKMLADKFEREMQRSAEEVRKTPEQIFTPERIAEARKRIFGV